MCERTAYIKSLGERNKPQRLTNQYRHSVPKLQKNEEVLVALHTYTHTQEVGLINYTYPRPPFHRLGVAGRRALGLTQKEDLDRVLEVPGVRPELFFNGGVSMSCLHFLRRHAHAVPHFSYLASL